jgi:hypothetical protein
MHQWLDTLDRTQRVPLAGALTGVTGAQAATAMAVVASVERSGSTKGMSQHVCGRRSALIEGIREARNVRQHGRGATATTAHGARSAIVVGVERREREGRESVAVGRHARAGKSTLRSGRNGHTLRLLIKLLILLVGMQHLGGTDIALFSSLLVGVDVAAVLVLNIGTLLPQSGAFLLPTLLGGETLFVGGNESVVLLVEPSLTLLKALPLLEGSRDIGLCSLNFALDFLLGLAELASAPFSTPPS